MNTTMSRAVALTALTAALAVGAVGCSSDSEPEETPSSTAPVETQITDAPAASEAPAPVETPDVEPGDPAVSTAALNEYVNGAQDQIPALLTQYEGTYSQILILAKDTGTIEYAYTYATAIDPVEGAAYFDELVPTFQESCDTLLFPEMANRGITYARQVTYTYYNADGSLLWSHTFAPSA